ncbi:MAG: hypothetical protein ACR2MG_02340 [Pyrinomonadaceae bacterium]
MVDQLTLSDIQSDISRIESVLCTTIFALENHQHPLRQAAFTELIVCLNDLLQKAKSFGVPVTFSDDIVLTNKILDITDTVNSVRNAVCHIPSPLNLLVKNEETQIKSVFGILYGKVPSVIVFKGEDILSSDYEDDICFTFGKFKLYLKRHIWRAFDEVKENLLPIISQQQIKQ